MSISNVQKQKNNSNLMADLGHIRKEEATTMRDYPGVSILLKDERVSGTIKKYNFNAESLAAIETVLVKSAYATIKAQERTHQPNKKLQRKLNLYLRKDIRKICADSKMIGSAAMIHSIDSLDEAVGGKQALTLEMLDIMGEKNSQAGILGVIFLTHGIVDRLKTIKTYENPVEVIKEFLYEKSEFMSNVRTITSIPQEPWS